MSQTNRSLPEMMQEIYINTPGAPEVLQLRSAPLPVLGEREVLIRVHAAGVNRPDVVQRLGQYPMPAGANPIPGLEVAGEIVAVGRAVQQFSVGDMVCALSNGGGYAEYCAVPAGQCLLVPPGVSMLQAAAIPETFFTVWANLFELGAASKGQRVLIHGGTSGIGSTALMLCQAFGIQAFATVGDAQKCDEVRKLGGVPINYREEDFATQILAATGAQGVDIILDIIGAAYLEQNIKALTHGGRLVIIGMMGGAVADKFSLLPIMMKKAQITGSLMRPRSAEEKAMIAQALRQNVWPLLAAGQCLPLIDSVFPLAQAAQAHYRMQGKHIGKIVLQVI